MKVVVAGLALLASPGSARADRRSFSHTYEYATLPEGQTELELWHTQSRDTWSAGSQSFFEQQLEIEHGITDHWDMALYTVFAESTQVMEQALHFDSARLESRYRFADRGEWPVDTVAYAEVAKEFGQSAYELEVRGIVARDFDKLTVAGNVIGELSLQAGVATEHRFGWAAGGTYELTARARLGLETWGTLEKATPWAVGPALALAPSSKFWLVGTAGFGLGERGHGFDFAGDAFSARVVMGLQL